MHGSATYATTNQFILGLSATATDDAVYMANETRYTTYKAQYYWQIQDAFDMTHFPTLNLTDCGPR